MYKIPSSDPSSTTIRRLSDSAHISRDIRNASYLKFLGDVKSLGIDIVEGPTIISPDYMVLRMGEGGYGPIGEQLDMQFKGTWNDHISEVKSKFPKTIVQTESIGDIPQWIMDDVNSI